VCEGGEGAKEQVTGVGHDGRAARGNTVLRLETKEAGKEVVDGNGRFEFGEAGDEFGGQAETSSRFCWRRACSAQRAAKGSATGIRQRPLGNTAAAKAQTKAKPNP